MTPPATARSIDRQLPGSSHAKVRPPRRVSGPVRPTGKQAGSRPRKAIVGARSTALAAAVALPAPGFALPKPRPRRAPAPSRRRRAAPSTRNPGIALRVVDGLERVSASSALDRLIRGRAWIGLLAFALIGIVAMQLVVLKLNTGIGRTLRREALLQRENSELGIENSVSSAENRVAPLASFAGMTLAPSGAVHFVRASPDDISRAASALSAASQAGADGQSQSSGEEGSTGTATTEQNVAGTGAAPGSVETSASTGPGGGESAAGSNEPSSGTASTGTRASTVSPPAASSTSTTSPSSGEQAADTGEQAADMGEQSAGASAAPSGGDATSGSSAPAGGTQAGSRE